MSDKPLSLRGAPPLIDARTRPRSTRTTSQRLEALLAVDDGGGLDRRRAAATASSTNTLILFTSDNGFFHGEHRVPPARCSSTSRRSGLPLLMRGPGVPRGLKLKPARDATPTWAPTILAAAHAPAGRLQDGRSLLDLIRDPRVEWGRELLLESGNPVQGLTTEGCATTAGSTSSTAPASRAVRPQERPVRADKPARRRRHCSGLRTGLPARLHALEKCAGPAAALRRAAPQATPPRLPASSPKVRGARRR